MKNAPLSSADLGNQSSILSDLKVIDLSTGVAGQFAARILGEYGAEVVLIEPSGGCALRHPQAVEDRYLFWHLNTGKKSIVLDLDQTQGQLALGHLLKSCDIVISDSTHDLQSMSHDHATLIACRIRDFSPHGPYANWVGNEMIHQALSGLMYSTGRADDKPLYGFGHRAYYSAGAVAVSSILGALIVRDGTGAGQYIDVSTHETAVSMSQNPVTQFAYNGTWMARGPYPGPFDIFQCADGWVSMYCRGDRWSALCKGLGVPQVAEHAQLSTIDNLVKNWSLAYELLQPVVQSLSVEQFLAIAETARALASRVNTMIDVLNCSHLAQRNYWQSLADGHIQKPILGPLFRFSTINRTLHHGAPDLNPASMSIQTSHEN